MHARTSMREGQKNRIGLERVHDADTLTAAATKDIRDLLTGNGAAGRHQDFRWEVELDVGWKLYKEAAGQKA